MIFDKKDYSCATDLKTWFRDFDISKTVVRYWINDKFRQAEDTCLYGYFKQFIDLGNGKWIVGIAPDEDYELVEYYPFDLVTFQIFGKDQEDEEER